MSWRKRWRFTPASCCMMGFSCESTVVTSSARLRLGETLGFQRLGGLFAALSLRRGLPLDRVLLRVGQSLRLELLRLRLLADRGV